MWVSEFVILLAALWHEDAAIVTAVFLVLHEHVSPGFALSAVAIGVLSNNFMLSALGAQVRRLPALRRGIWGERVEGFAARLRGRPVSAILLCRSVPGTLLPTFLGCGWAVVPVARFAPPAIASAAVYLLCRCYYSATSCTAG